MLIVAQGPPARGGIPTFVATVVQDRRLAAEHRLRLLNTTRRTERRGGVLSAGNLARVVADAARVWRGARRVDVVHLNTALVPAFPLLRVLALAAAARCGGAAVVVHAHSGRLAHPETYSPVVARLLPALRIADVLVAVSEAGAGTLRRSLPPGRRVERLDNAVRVDDFPPAAGRGQPPVLLYVGVLARYKGLVELCAALRALRERGRELRLVVAGGAGEVGVAEADRIRDEIVAIGLGDALLGALPPEDVRRLLASADVFVLPSYWEGQPFSLLEAMAGGLAIVATRVGAIPEMVVDGESALLVPPRDADALTAALDRVLTDRDLRARLGRQARMRAERHYDVGVLARRLSCLYTSLPARRAR